MTASSASSSASCPSAWQPCVTPAHRAIPFPIDAVKQRLLSIGVFDTDSKVVLEYKINNYYDENEGEDDSPVNADNIHQAEADNHLTVKDSCWDQ